MHENYLVFTGRPNAGKSSIIRRIFGINIAIGKHPGTTRRIKKYPLSRGLYLVDMPGFGKMSGVSRVSENKGNQKIIDFLEFYAQDIVLAVHVLDISIFLEVTQRLEKKTIKSLDVEMVQFLEEILGIFPFIAANKIDKEKDDRIKIELRELIHKIGNEHPTIVMDKIFPVSAKTGEGLSILKNGIHEWLVEKGYRMPFKL